MELFTILFTLVIVVPITFPFLLVRLAIYCLSFYLKKKHSITLRVGKCGLISYRSVTIRFPYHLEEISNEEEQADEDCDDDKTDGNINELCISVDNVRLSSLYLDNSCVSILSICFSNIVIDGPLNKKSRLPIKIGSCEFPINRIRGDFLRHYRENFNISINDVVIVSKNFNYRIEKLNVIKTSTGQNLQVNLDRIIFSDLSIPEVRTYSELPEELTRQRILFIEQLKILYFMTHNKNLNAKFVGDCFLQCNLEFYQDICSVICLFRALIKQFRKSSQTSLELDAKVSEMPNQTLIAKVELEGRLSIGAATSEIHKACIDTNSLEINACFPGTKTLKTDMACLHFDENTILVCTMLSISHYPIPGISSVLDRKQNCCGYKLTDDTNSLLCVDLEAATCFFPYKYDFAEACNEKLIGNIKWLKRFHQNPDEMKKTRLINCDISIKINRFVFEIEDDPFETRIRNNYMLLEDEYSEQLKRDQTLQEKINELKRTNLMLASSIVEELNRALAKKNSDIYIQRSKQLYSSESRSVPLFRITVEEAELKILADSSFHNHNDIRRLIKVHNPEAQMSEDVTFSTIWCRIISSNFKNVDVSLRDFPLPMVDAKDLTIKGMLIGVEQTAVARARRDCRVYIGRNSRPQSVERSMTTLKLFHNLQLRCTTASYTHGPCWEPVLQQVTLAFDDIISASSDPSPSLTWWDKMRFIFHGPLKLNCNQLSVILHASNDPYNQTELIELTLSRAQIDLNSGRIRFKGDFDALLHTASKYDECRFVHLPNLDLTTHLSWNCVGNSNDHFSVMPCAPDKVPDYSSHHSHDSYRSFRSQSLSLHFNIETQFISPTSSLNPENMPSMLFFGSTIRWLENQKFIFTGPPKLTRRGKLFSNTKPRKPSLSRILRDIRITSSLSSFQIVYWSSVTKRHGIQILGGELVHSSEHSFKLLSNNGESLNRRPQAFWQTNFMNSNLTNVEVWLYNLSSDDLDEFNEFNVQTNLKNRQYFISLNRIKYNRESIMKKDELNDFDAASSGEENTFKEAQRDSRDDQIPNHKLVVYDLKAAWTKDNRDVILGIFDAFIKSQQLKRNLSTEALKLVRIESPSSASIPQNISNTSPPYRHQRQPSTTSLIITNSPNPVSSVSKNRAVSMLQKLIADSENNPTVYTEESHSGVASETHLYGVEACSMDDVIDITCLIELVNSQVVLCGTETPGYVIVSSAQTEIRQATHLPVWKNRTLLSKTTWTGSLKDMQYYATVDGSYQDVGSRRVFANENDIQWLNPGNIETRSFVYDYPDLVGSGYSVGGVVSPVVGKYSSDGESGSHTIELQRIISRCDCQFYYASHTDGVPEDLQHLIPPLPEDDMFIEPWDKEVGVDSFTLNHQDLDISTNSQQYAMIMDIINHLLLFVEPHKKTAFEKLERMRFRFQLSADEDQREPISQMQDQVRRYISYLKRLERERYLVYRASIDDSMTQNEHEHDYRLSLNTLSCEIDGVKEQLNSASEELAMMISCYKEMQLGAHKAQKQQAASQQGSGAFFANVIKRDEICFKNARWRLTDSDGQLGLADIVLNNFLYSKVVKSDDSVEHTIELGHLHVSNLIPNQAYKDVLHPTELQANIPLDRQRSLRVYCRELAPVGGIPVKEHLEVNVVPFTIEVTLQFFQKMVKFFFPEKEAAKDDKSRRVLDLSGEHQLARFGSKRRNKDKDKDKEKNLSETMPPAGSGSIACGSSGSRGSGLSNPAMTGNTRADDTISTVSTTTMNSNASVSSINSNQRRGEEIEKMRERASKNHTFVYVKVPGIPVRISYKGKKQKNVTDLKNMSLTLPTYEYHNCTWTWLDLLMAVKNDSKHTVIKQALKQKMKIRPSSIWSKATTNNDQQASSTESSSIAKDKSSLPVTDEDKARLLLGQYARKSWRSDSDSTSQTSFDKFSE